MKRASSVSATGLQWEALGTSVVLRVTSANALPVARELVERELAAIDRTCSRFREDTDLMRVNRAGGRPVRVDALLIEALGVAMRAAQLTEGDVDPTLGAALELAGYDRDWRLMEDAGRESTMSAAMSGESSARPAGEDARAALPPDLRPACARAGTRSSSTPSVLTVRVPEGISWIWAPPPRPWQPTAPRVPRRRHRRGRAREPRRRHRRRRPRARWAAGGARHRRPPRRPARARAAGRRSHGGGLATSGTTVRRWRHDGMNRHHIIDPRPPAPPSRARGAR